MVGGRVIQELAGRAAERRALRAAGYRGAKARRGRSRAEAERIVAQVRAAMAPVVEAVQGGEAGVS